MHLFRRPQVLFILSFCLCFGTARSLWAAEGVSSAWYQDPVTVEAYVRLPPEEEVHTLEALWLAGLGTSPDGPPGTLGLVWSQRGGLLPVWALQLQSDLGLLPADVRAETGTGVLRGSAVFPLPGVGKPRWGHVYHTVLSYDPATGALSLWVHDATAGETVISAEYTVGTLGGPFYAGAGSRRGGTYAAVDTITVAPGYVPRGMTWRIGELSGESAGVVALSRIDRGLSGPVGIYIDLKNPVQGTVRVTAQARGRVRELAHIVAPAGSVTVPIPESELVPGSLEFLLEYRDADGTIRFAERRHLYVGYLKAAFEPTIFDRETERVLSGVTLETDGPLTTGLRIDAELTRMIWDPAQRTYVEEAWGTIAALDAYLETEGEPVYVPLSLPVPDSEPALWSVRFSVAADVDVALGTSGTARMFTTYEPAHGFDEGPFTLVVLPDTQYQTHASPQGGNPEILTRMIHWIAENAAAERIGLVVHVGDVTDHNLPTQWEAAQNSLYLLEGLVPYTLTVGNHDIGFGGNAANRDTLLNAYFPVARYAARPWFGGTFEEGRLENNYQTFRLGGERYLVLSLEFLPRDEVLEWANGVVAAHPDHKVIVVTHTYTSVSGSQRSVYGERYAIVDSRETTVNTGVDVWNKLIRRHPNIFMVLSGHVTPDGTVPRQVKVGDHGTRVYEMLFNFQHRPRGGDGWLALLRFTPGSQLVAVELFSPYLDAYRQDLGGAFGVPFCIDLESVYYVPVNEACPALTTRDAVRTAW